MNDMDMIKAIAELLKQSIDNNDSFSEWERWWRKCGVDETVELAKRWFYQQDPNAETDNIKGDQ